jgi:hypothetical protein
VNDWRRREHASTGARWVTVPPFDLERSSTDYVRVVDDSLEGLSSVYPEKSREWRERQLNREPDPVDLDREADLEREDSEPDLDRDL